MEDRKKMKGTLLGALCLSAAVAALPGTASVVEACSYWALSSELLTDRMQPSGALMWRVSCAGPGEEYCATGKPRLHVGPAEEDDEVPGEVEYLRGGASALYVLFRPDEPLSEGSRYWTRLEHEDPEDSLNAPEGANVMVDGQYMARVPSPEDVPLKRGDARLAVGDAYCCGGRLACFPQCITEQQIVNATLTAEVPSGPGFLYRLQYVDDGAAEEDAEPAVTGWVRGTSDSLDDRAAVAHFAHPSDRYCASVEVFAVATGERSVFEHCEDADPAVDVGATVDFELGPDGFQSDCEAPPRKQGCQGDDCTSEPLRELWCEARAECAEEDACAAHSSKPSRYCDDDSAQSPEAKGTPDAGAVAVVMEAEGEGCSATRRGDVPLSGRFALCFGLLALVARARRGGRIPSFGSTVR